MSAPQAMLFMELSGGVEAFWDQVHPRGAGDDFETRAAALSALDLPTVVFPLQYAPLCEARRIGVVSYRVDSLPRCCP